jgi:uncharacterized protein YPO0396
MTKQELQAKIKEKVKPGIKPSQLKRSKSLSDIPKAPPLPKSSPTLTKSKSAEELESIPSSKELVEQLETQISVLELKLETSKREKDQLAVDNHQLATALKLAEKQVHAKTPPASLLQEQLKEKQKEIESLRKQLETAHSQINELKNPDYSQALIPAQTSAQAEFSELDQSLIARHQNLKDFFQQYEKTIKLEQELAENIDYASDELIRQDDEILKLSSENRQLKRTNHQLSQDLRLASRLAEMRRMPLPSPNFDQSLTYLKYFLYSLSALTLALILLNRKPNHA